MAQTESYNPKQVLSRIEGQSRKGKNMAEGTSGSGTEGAVSTPGSTTAVLDQSRDIASPEARLNKWLSDKLGKPEQDQPRPPTKRYGFTEEQVAANASFEETEQGKAARLVAAQKLLGSTPLSQQQQEAILKAHTVGANEPGAGVYHYDQPQLRQKAEILKEAGFNPEERGKLIEAGIVGLAPDWLKNLAQEPSAFENAQEVIKLASEISAADLARLSVDKRNELTILYTHSKGTMDRLLNPSTEAEKEELQRSLYFTRDDIRRLYVQVTQASPKGDPDSWSGTTSQSLSLEDKIKIINNAVANYEEVYWSWGDETLKKVFGNVDVVALQKKYKGTGKYLYSRIAAAIIKELKGVPLQPNSDDVTKQEFGDFYLIEIKREIEDGKSQAEKDRRERRKRATAEERLHYNRWREKFDFSWAETPEELDDSIDDLLDLFQQRLPEEAEEAVFQESQQEMQKALSAYEEARNNLRIPANSEIAQHQREAIVGGYTTVAGARLLESKNGLEYFIKLKLDYAANYDGYTDASYVRRKGFAIMADKLSENEGAIYHGGPDWLKKPLAGDTKTYRGELEEVAINYGATNELYLTEDDFERANLGEREIIKEVARMNLSVSEAQRLIHQKTEERKKIKELMGKTDFETARLDKEDIERTVAKLKLSPEDSKRMIAYRMALRKEARARAGRYSWDDGIEELLLVDSRGLAKARAIANPQQREKAIAKVRGRTRVFREIKELSDKEDGLFGLTEEQRREEIRQRIRAKIAEVHKDKQGNSPLLDAIDRLPDQAAQDRALWKWVEQFNKRRIEVRQKGSNIEPWFPSLWDEERLMIRRPEDMIDRALTEEEFKAMVEKIEDPYEGLTNEQIEQRIVGEFTHQFHREAQAQHLSFTETASLVARTKEEKYDTIKRKIEDVLFERQQREARAIRNFNFNVAQDKFFELQARWGGLTTRVIDEETGGVKLRTIYSFAEEIIKAKIDKEAKEVEDKVNTWKAGWEAGWENEWKLGYAATHPRLTQPELDEDTNLQRIRFTATYKTEIPQQIEQRVNQWKLGYIATHPGMLDKQFNKALNYAKEQEIVKQTRKYRRNCVFAATLGLRELGIADDLPIWNYYYYSDVSQIGAFSELVGYTDDDKLELPDLLDRPRREMEAVFYFLAELHMDGRILDVVDDPGHFIEGKDGTLKPAHEERRVRARVINEGGVQKLRNIFENMFMISTSGGVEMVDMITKLGNLGVYDEAWQHGQRNKLRWQGYRKRRTRWEYRKQSFYNTREWTDPISHVEMLSGGNEARKHLTGGEIKGQGRAPGALREPYDGLWQLRSSLLSKQAWKSETFGDSANVNWDDQTQKRFQDAIEKEESLKDLTKTEQDELVKLGGGILKNLLNFMDSRRYLENRAGAAPKNFKYDNELMARAFIAESLKRKPVIAKPGEVLPDGSLASGGEMLAEVGGEVLGEDHLGFAIQGRSKMVDIIFEGLMRTSSYHIFDEAERRYFDGLAKKADKVMKDKRDELVGKFIPVSIQAQIKLKEEDGEEGFTALERRERQALQEFGKLRQDGQITNQDPKGYRKKYGAKFKEINDSREALEVEIATLANQATKATLDTEIANGDLTNQSLRKTITKRREYLASMHTSEANTEWDINRIINQYIEIKVHKEVVGEWAARLIRS